jgi:hypothetical protein
VGAILIGSHIRGTPKNILASLVVINLLLFYFPTLMSLLMGQWPLFSFLFLAWAWLAWRDSRFALAGGILGALAGIKLFFGAFFLFFLARREWRASISFAAAGFTTVLLSVLALGPDSHLEYVRLLQGVNWFSSGGNASSLGFFKRVFGEPGNDPLFHAPLVGSILGRVSSLLGAVILVVMARRRSGPGRAEDQNDLAFSSCIVLMLLISPLGWIYYFPFLVIPLVVAWRVVRGLPERGWLLLLLTIAWVMSTIPGTLVERDSLGGDPALILGWAGVYSYALVLLTIILWKIQSRLSVSIT